MSSTSLRRLVWPAAFSLFGTISVPAVGAPTAEAPKEPGDLWEVTSQMTMEGMPMAMPAHTQKVCAAKEWKEPPGPKDDMRECQTLDFKTTPTKATWTVRCAGPPAMTGEGEITRSSPDAYAGQIKMTSEDGVMTMTLKGKRVGDCDAGEAKR